MKAKLTVTIDEELVPIAKQYARNRGLSLSQVIENSLRLLTSGATETFSERWKGRFKPAAKKDARYERLAAKYLR